MFRSVTLKRIRCEPVLLAIIQQYLIISRIQIHFIRGTGARVRVSRVLSGDCNSNGDNERVTERHRSGRAWKCIGEFMDETPLVNFATQLLVREQ